MTYKTKGIIIRRRNFGEADRLLTIYTEQKGKVSAIAKGVRKPLSKLGGYLELFYLVDFVIAEGKNLDIITGVHIIEDFPELRKDLRVTHQVYYVAEVLDKLVHEDEKHQEVFDLVVKILSCLGSHSGFSAASRRKTGSHHDGINFLRSRNKFGMTVQGIPRQAQNDILLHYFELNLLSLLGHKPELYKCVVCGRKLVEGENFFSNHLGGIVDKDCCDKDRESLPITTSEIKILRLLLEGDISILKKLVVEKQNNLAKIIRGFVESITEKEIKSKKFLL